MKLINTILVGAAVVFLAPAVPVLAQTARTTPVEVKAPVQIDSTVNTVKAAQSGAWSVSVINTPTVSVTNTPAVTVSGTPSVNVANTPSVSVSNTPTVTIGNSPNVTALAAHSMYRPTWSTTTISSSTYAANSGTFSCAGYKEMRVVIGFSPQPTAAQLAQIRVDVYWKVDIYSLIAGSLTLGPNQSLISGGTPSAMSAFTMPVLADQCYLTVTNTSSTAVTLSNAYSWVYLVN